MGIGSKRGTGSPCASGGREFERCVLSRDLKQALDRAERGAKALADDYLSAEHLLLGLLECGAVLRKLFQRHDVERSVLLEKMNEVRGSQR